MKHYLSLFFLRFGQEARPTRMASFLAEQGHLTLCCAQPLATDKYPGEAFIPLAPRPKTLFTKITRAITLLSHQFEKDIWNASALNAYEAMKDLQFDAIICNDLLLLPIACAVKERPQNKGKTKIIFDAREFYPRQFENKFLWQLFLAKLNDYVCRKYLPCADTVITVGDGLAREYKKQYGIDCVFVPSTPPFHELHPKPVNPAHIRLINHGIAYPNRQLEVMIEAVRLADSRFYLDFMLLGEETPYYKKLVQLAADCDRIHFVPPVPLGDIVATSAQYDMGIYIVSPCCFNQKFMMPNKFFEFIQSRLAIGVGPSPDMAALVKKYHLGMVAADYTPQTFANALNALTSEDIDMFKANSHAVAEKFSWQHNVEILKTLL